MSVQRRFFIFNRLKCVEHRNCLDRYKFRSNRDWRENRDNGTPFNGLTDERKHTLYNIT